MSIQQKFNQLKSIIAVAEEDMIKYTTKGNKTAGTRLRKHLTEIKDISTDIRREVLEGRKIKV
ncbi:MAG: hypothetical protein R2794_08155 [Chitinophagales bacterium]